MQLLKRDFSHNREMIGIPLFAIIAPPFAADPTEGARSPLRITNSLRLELQCTGRRKHPMVPRLRRRKARVKEVLIWDVVDADAQVGAAYREPWKLPYTRRG